MSGELRAAYDSKMQQATSSIKYWQKFYQAGNSPVHLKSAGDKRLMKFLMPLSYVGLAFGFSMFTYAALGKMKRPTKS